MATRGDAASVRGDAGSSEREGGKGYGGNEEETEDDDIASDGSGEDKSSAALDFDVTNASKCAPRGSQSVGCGSAVENSGGPSVARRGSGRRQNTR